VEVRYESSFEKDLKSIGDKNLLKKIKKVIEEVKQADDSSSINNLKKLRGYDTFYRIRIGDYRIGIEITGDKLIFTRFLHRKEIYRFFP
jgi:mRNA interferase RelE/StbE